MLLAMELTIMLPCKIQNASRHTFQLLFLILQVFCSFVTLNGCKLRLGLLWVNAIWFFFFGKVHCMHYMHLVFLLCCWWVRKNCWGCAIVPMCKLGKFFEQWSQGNRCKWWRNSNWREGKKKRNVSKKTWCNIAIMVCFWCDHL